MLMAGLPTTAIDIYNTQDITNFTQAPAGRWTLRLTPDDLQVFDWLKHNTEPSAIVQIDPAPRDPEHWAYLPAFGERRMAAGLPISMVPLAKYQQASAEIRTIYDEEPLLGLRARRPRRHQLRHRRPTRARGHTTALSNDLPRSPN